MKIVHTADLHIDSPLHLGAGKAQSDRRRTEICTTFVRIAKLAKAEGASAVLIAGDLFDSSFVSDSAASLVTGTIRSYPEITFCYLKGNHDECDVFDENIPDNLILLSGHTTFRLEEHILLSADPAYPFAQSDYNILISHGDPSDLSGYTLPALAYRNIDYLALGHYHEYSQGKLDDRGIWCYPGCPNGRGFDECGVKGAVLLDTDNKQSPITFVPLSDRICREITLDVTGIQDFSELLKDAGNALNEAKPEDLVKLTLIGQKDKGLAVDTDLLANQLDSYFYLKIRDKSVRSADLPDRTDHTLEAEFLRLLEDREDLSDEDRSAIQDLVITALRGGVR